MAQSIEGGVVVVNTLSTKNNGDYPLVMAESVELENGENLEDKIAELELSGGGTSNYNDLTNKPQINGVELNGNKTSSDLKIGEPTQEQVSTAVENYLTENPVQSGATEEQAQQIEQNKNDIENIVEKKSSINLLDLSKCEKGYAFPSNGIFQSSDMFMITEYIPVIGGKYLVSSSNGELKKINFLSQFSDIGKVIVKSDADYQNISSAILDERTKYIRVTSVSYTPSAKGLQLEINDTGIPSPYQEYTNGTLYEIKKDCIENVWEEIDLLKSKDFMTERIKSSKFYGKKVTWYGDSIIQSGWWSGISNNFNLTSVNCGVGGSTIIGSESDSSFAMCTKNRMLGNYANVEDPNTGEITKEGIAIPEDTDYIIVSGGVNDWVRNIQLGSKIFKSQDGVLQFDSLTSFYQACHMMFKNLTELRPNAKIICIGTSFCKFINETTFDDKYGLLNNEKLTSIDYGDALCEIAGLWGIESKNLGRYMGINDNNVAVLLNPELNSGHLHPNTEEAKEKFYHTFLDYILTLES